MLLTESTSAYYPGRGGVLYLSSKFAVRGLVTALAHDLAPAIRVNGVAPAARSAPTCGACPAWARPRAAWATPPVAPKNSRRECPLQVALTGEDHAWSYVFLASDRSRGITGGVLHPDGGIGVSAAPQKRS